MSAGGDKIPARLFLCYYLFMNLTDKAASKFLGKKSQGFKTYTPSALVAVPREENRIQYSINSSNLPFEGFDIWHCYEFSSLTENGLPVTRVLKLCYNCESPYIIESKSLKLYLNSFNMSKFGENTEECLKICKKLIEKDLREKLNTVVEADFLSENLRQDIIFSNYEDIMDLVDERSLSFSKFKEAPEVLSIEKFSDKSEEKYIKFGSLRSNCRVTHQPDFGDLYIYYKSKKTIKPSSLLEYLVSFRSEFHFHEECCEMIYKRLYDILDSNDELCICALYTRRGGIDITPVRYSHGLKLNDVQKLLNINNFVRSGIKQ